MPIIIVITSFESKYCYQPFSFFVSKEDLTTNEDVVVWTVKKCSETLLNLFGFSVACCLRWIQDKVRASHCPHVEIEEKIQRETKKLIVSDRRAVNFVPVPSTCNTFFFLFIDILSNHVIDLLGSWRRMLTVEEMRAAAAAAKCLKTGSCFAQLSTRLVCAHKHFLNYMCRNGTTVHTTTHSYFLSLSFFHIYTLTLSLSHSLTLLNISICEY